MRQIPAGDSTDPQGLFVEGSSDVCMRIRPRYIVGLLLGIMLIDALALVVVADLIGWVVTVALVVLTGLLGMLLVRAEGRHTLRSVERKLKRSELPTDELLDGGLLIAAGAFLLTPGLLTDGVGFLLAFPISRVPLRELLKRGVVVPYIDKRTGGLGSGKVWTGGFPGDAPGPGSGEKTTSEGASTSKGGFRFGAGSTDDVIDVESEQNDPENGDGRYGEGGERSGQ